METEKVLAELETLRKDLLATQKELFECSHKTTDNILKVNQILDFLIKEQIGLKP